MIFFVETLSIATELKLHLHLTKSPKHDNIYKLCTLYGC